VTLLLRAGARLAMFAHWAAALLIRVSSSSAWGQRTDEGEEGGD
jgi:hypothetical protein